jgi:hypothetical protein
VLEDSKKYVQHAQILPEGRRVCGGLSVCLSVCVCVCVCMCVCVCVCVCV